MDKYKRYMGVIFFSVAILSVCFIAFHIVRSMYVPWEERNAKLETLTKTLNNKKTDMANVQKKLAKLKESVISSQKKIYSPVESNLGSDTLFFTLYRDLIEMVHSNSIKIDSIEYAYNPTGDPFVQHKPGNYFVCDVNLKLVSNYINLGKLIQDIYQYPYYLKINNIEVYPYPKDKKILLTTMSIRLYAHTAPEEESAVNDVPQIVEGANTPIPQ